MYQTEEVIPWDSEPGANGAWINNPGVPKFNAPALKVPKKDPTLQDPHCVLNLMAKHYSRYTLEKVYEVTGIDPELLELIYKTYAASGAPEKERQHSLRPWTDSALLRFSELSYYVRCPASPWKRWRCRRRHQRIAR